MELGGLGWNGVGWFRVEWSEVERGRVRWSGLVVKVDITDVYRFQGLRISWSSIHCSVT